MHLVRTGSAAAVGVASGMLETSSMAPIVLGGFAITPAALVEGLALIGGGALQYFSPFTMPNIVDGVVDGGAALLGRRVGTMVGTRFLSGSAYARGGGSFAPYQVNGAGAARGYVGSVAGAPKRTLV
ncbi:MAG: hypothetical protein C4542_09605 [Dehalococcoidia bacterium]|nr:MAG: hypothetical protein C4542_09605 [Dehalococcoidia bacterium]